jgi:hypothetical protein
MTTVERKQLIDNLREELAQLTDAEIAELVRSLA